MNYKKYKKDIKSFIKKIESNYNFHLYIGRRIINDIKKNKIRRCTCRKFNHNTLNINFQCPNPISTISNMCYNCDKNLDYLGFVNIYPAVSIIDQYNIFGKHHNIPFKKNYININTHKKYITNTYIKTCIKDFEQYSDIVIVKIPDPSDTTRGVLKDKYSNYIGTYSCWLDTTNEIPLEFKNDEHYVVNPDNHLPLIEYNLEKLSIYHNLTNRIYRKYIYNSTSNALTLTRNIIDM